MKDGTGKMFRGKPGLAAAQELVRRGWVVVVVTDGETGEQLGFWVHEVPLSEFRALIGDNPYAKRHLVDAKYGPALIEGLEVFLVLDSYTDAKNRVVFGPGKGVRHTQVVHYRVPS